MYVKDGWLHMDDGQELLVTEYGLPGLTNGMLYNQGDTLWTETAKLTPAQRKEIAAFMIARWQEWATT